MRLRSRFLWLIVVLTAGLFQDARAQSRDYFSHRVILKYKSSARLQNIRAKTGQSPKRQVQQLLQNVGMSRMKQIFSFRDHPALKTTANKALRQSAENLARTFEVTYHQQADAKILAAKLSSMPGVAYAEPRYKRRMQFVPNDPITNPYQDYHRFEKAWDLTHGSSDVIIAVVDGGVNYLHPELDSKLWVNTEEVPAGIRRQVDQDADGTITSTEVLAYLNQTNSDFNNDGSITLKDALATGSSLLTGSDTDGNGFEDDIFGWDFWQSGGVSGQPITEDNNPLSDGTDHGAHVAGIATAETNNDQGLAGTGFDSRFMAIKAGGIPDDPSTTDDESRAIGFGFEGIMYAAMEGADVINCSWGGGGFSAFENDVIEFATNAGALVVAAAGNEGLRNVDFPSAYQKVLSVGSVETSDQLASYSNKGYNVDVFATGSGIESTSYGDDFVTKSGTSMSTPVAAGLAGLIKALHPGWSPLHIAGQIRSSATFLNSSDTRKGHGKIDAFKAVNTNLPAVRILSAEFADANGQKLGRDESGGIKLKIINYGHTTSGLSLQLESLAQGGISLSNPNQNVGALATGDSTMVSFDVSIAADYNLNIIPAFRLNLDDASQNYTDFDVTRYTNILFDVVDANNIKTSFGGDGTVGFTDALAGRGGVGFITRPSKNEAFSNENNLLFEGGLMIEADNTVFDVVRGADGKVEKDFDPIETFMVTPNGSVSDQDGQTSFRFQNQTGTSSARVQLKTFAYDQPDLRNVIFLKYRLTNTSASASLKNIYLGLFNDWDIGNTTDANSVAYSRQDSILYLKNDAQDSSTPVVAVAHLGTISSALAIKNFPETPPTNPSIDLTDGFSDREKSASLKAGLNRTSVSSADVSAVTASGPYSLSPDATLTVGFVYAFGRDLNELRQQVKAARQQAPFEVSPTGQVISSLTPESTNLMQNYPNPFSDRTYIRFDLKEDSHVTLTIYDEIGRKVRVLRDRRMEADEYRIPFRPTNLSSGIYYLRLETDTKKETMPFTYIK